jgi:hypothetical protein
MNIKFTSAGIPAVLEWLKKIGYSSQRKATELVTEYLVGNQEHGLKHYPPYKYVPYAKAYGGFKSAKQRRYVMAMIKEGRIDPGYPHRTGEFQRGWSFQPSGANRYTIKNDTPYAGYLVGNDYQANMPRLIGWRKIADIIKSNLSGAFRHAQAGLKKWIAEQKGR